MSIKLSHAQATDFRLLTKTRLICATAAEQRNPANHSNPIRSCIHLKNASSFNIVQRRAFHPFSFFPIFAVLSLCLSSPGYFHLRLRLAVSFFFCSFQPLKTEKPAFCGDGFSLNQRHTAVVVTRNFCFFFCFFVLSYCAYFIALLMGPYHK